MPSVTPPVSSEKKLIIVGIILVILLGGLFFSFIGCSPLDFSTIKYGFGPLAGGKKSSERRPSASQQPQNGKGTSSETQKIIDNTRPEREPNAARASSFLASAIHDYYNGSYPEALRRLERAKWHNPANYSLFRLSGQIFFEQSRYRKAFNDWMRATQLANDDRTMERDLDVVKRLIRFSRSEIDRLQRNVNEHPEDRISAAKLRELELRLRD
ncbi:MAG: hypothetical protein WA705_28685 [Candidatus Ozemobacteraceae bacterium]